MSKLFKTAIETLIKTLIIALITFTTYYFVKHIYERSFQSKSFTVYLITNKTKMENIRLYYNGTNFQSVLAEDYTKEDIEKEFAVMRLNVNLAKKIFQITANTIELRTANGHNTLCKCIYITNKDGYYNIVFFRTKKDYDAFLKEIF